MASDRTARIHRPPSLYRGARLLRRLSLVVLVLLILFVASAGYSAFSLVRSSPQSGGYAASFSANDTLSVTGSVSLSNPGYYPVSGLSLGLRIENATGTLLGDLSTAPVTLAARSTTDFPVRLFVPISATGAAASLLVRDQFLQVGVWGNATYAYLFPVSVHFVQQKSWGAPFASLAITAGTPRTGNGGVNVPVTVSFANHASFTESGAITLVLLSTGGTECANTSFPVLVAPGGLYDQTENVALAGSCTIAGGSADATFVSGGQSVSLPPVGVP